MSRPEWHAYFMGIAKAVAARGDCMRDKVGAVITTADHRIISTGYNGSPAGSPGCHDGACHRRILISQFEAIANAMPMSPSQQYTDNYSEALQAVQAAECDTIHAELNALMYAGAAAQGGTMYVTRKPCRRCEQHARAMGIAVINYPGARIEL